MKCDYSWPSLPDGAIPMWIDNHFEADGANLPFLPYSENASGWDDGLTSLHRRESAGMHPIDIASRSIAVKIVRKALGHEPKRLLEIGSSEGHLLRDLKAALPNAMIVGSEVAAGALAQIAEEQPGTPLLRLNILDCPLPSQSFDAIVALNVLEHIEDDIGAIAQMSRLLRPGGILFLEVPAGPHLFDAYDRQLRHFRRYRMSELVSKIQRAGLQPIVRSHIGFFVYPGFTAVKLINRLKGKFLASRSIVAKSIQQTRHNSIISALFYLERCIFGRISWPMGIRCVVLAEKN